MARHEALTSYAAERAKLLLGCYRTGEANDPVTYVAAITAILSRYPEDVITTVTHPATGLPKKKSWLPTIKEVSDACDEAAEFNIQNAARLKRVQEQLEAREREDRGEKLTLDQLKAKYGPDWGIIPNASIVMKMAVKAPSWGDIANIYQMDPSRMQALIKRDDEFGSPPL
jgi:hypothetical protein